MNISKRLKLLRATKGFSYYYVTKESGITGTQIKEMEEGKRQPTIETLQKLLNVYGLTLSEFFNDDQTAYFPTEKEKQLLENFRIMDEDKADALLNMSELLKR